MGNFINNLLDNLLSTLWRVLDLPIYFIVLLIVVVMIVFSLMVLKLKKRVNKKRLLIVNAAILLFCLVLIVDKKMSNLKKEINFLNHKITESQFNSGTQYVSNKENKIYSLDSLKAEYPNAGIYELPLNEGMDLISFKTAAPNVVAYIAVIDLLHPGVEVHVTPEKKEKYLTSTFAKNHNCEIAINGEAGESMAMDCALGEWTGNWISKGEIVLLEDSDKRPFIGFSKNNLASYSKEEKIDTTYSEYMYNAIWGRFDILKNGEIVDFETDNPYARTVMGVDASGTKLYLMIVDGKRPDYSQGLSYAECAKIINLIGADNAMACDQGGSSCMYVKAKGGIVNRPADSDGLERPIYSHFGVSFK